MSEEAFFTIIKITLHEIHACMVEFISLDTPLFTSLSLNPEIVAAIASTELSSLTLERWWKEILVEKREKKRRYRIE